MSNADKRLKDAAITKYVQGLQAQLQQVSIAYEFYQAYYGQLPPKLAEFAKPMFECTYTSQEQVARAIGRTVDNFKQGLAWDHVEAPADATGDSDSPAPNYGALTLAPSLSAGSEASDGEE